jgi:CRP/FNR family cyclic AMP-dependent transcriptional regulator
MYVIVNCRYGNFGFSGQQDIVHSFRDGQLNSLKRGWTAMTDEVLSTSRIAADALKASDIIGSLSQATLDKLGGFAVRQTLAAHKTLFLQEDIADALYIVECGAIEICVMSANGKKLSLNVMRPNDVFGEISALDGGPRTATAIAQTTSTVLRISAAQVLEETRTDPDFAREIIQVLCARLRWVSRQVEELGLLQAEPRLASRLLLLHRRFADPTGALQISQAELADFMGTSREATNRILQVWRSKGLIDLARGVIRIRKPNALEDLTAG